MGKQFLQEHYVIIGAGQSGAALAERLRANGFKGKLSLFGREPFPPYQRPPLSKKYLSGEWTSERLWLRNPRFWKEHSVSLRLGLKVTEIDVRNRTLSCGDERTNWDKLALTTGSVARRLPETVAAAGTVHVLRSIADVDRLRPELRPGHHLLIAGGGFVGLETAAVARETGLEVTIIEAADRILNRVVCRQTADYFRRLHLDHGVTIVEGRSMRSVTSDGRTKRVELDDGLVMHADLVLAGIGARANTELAERAGIETGDGIVVDKRGRTSAADVWAAGDCARFPLRGIHTRLESVQNAIDQAKAVADDMLGQGADYEPLPWFWSDQFDTKLQIAGLSHGHDKIVSKAETRGFSNWYLKGSEVIAVDAINAPRAFMTARKMLAEGRGVELAGLTVS